MPSQRSAELLLKLTTHVLRVNGPPGGVSEDAFADVFSLMGKLASSSLQPSVALDAQTITDMIKRNCTFHFPHFPYYLGDVQFMFPWGNLLTAALIVVVKQHRTSDALKIVSLAAKLSSPSSTLAHSASLLYIFTVLSGSAGNDNQQYSMGPFVGSKSGQIPATLMTVAPTGVKKGGATIQKSELASSHSIQDVDMYKRGGEVSTPSFTTTQLQHSPEHVLVRMGIYLCQGLPVKGFSTSSNGSLILDGDIHIALSAPVRESLARLHALGYLYASLCRMVEKASSVASPHNMGLSAGSFWACVRQECAAYAKNVSSLEGWSAPALTLRRLLMQVGVESSNLTMLYTVCQHVHVQELKGGALVSFLHVLGTHYPSPLYARLHRSACLPVLQFIEAWICNGSLDDKWEEFFIVRTNESISNWTSAFALKTAMLPAPLSVTTASSILAIGRSLHYLWEVCNDHDEMLNSMDVWGGERENRNLAAAERLLLSEEVIAKMAQRAGTIVHARLKQVLFHNHQLHAHMSLIKQVLLCGAGDATLTLLAEIEPTLNASASSLSLLTLTASVQAALRSVYDSVGLRESTRFIAVKLLPASPAATGWDTFSLTYDAPHALAVILTPPVLLSYSAIHNFLWSLKRVEYSINACWNGHMGGMHDWNEGTLLLHRAHLLRAELVHFWFNVTHYVMTEIVEVSWHHLMEAWNRATDVDGLRDAHATFLTAVEEGAFLADTVACKELMLTMKKLQALTLRFVETQSQVLAALETQRQWELRAQAEQISREMAGKWSVTSPASAGQVASGGAPTPEELQAMTTNMVTALSSLHLEYRRDLREFLQGLHTQGTASLKFLAVRLDFNEFYTNEGLL